MVDFPKYSMYVISLCLKINDEALVTCCGETGLLGLAFHPNYASNRYFYTYRTQTFSQLTSVVSRFTANPDFRTADPSIYFGRIL